MLTRFARFIGRDARGRRLYRVPVRVVFNNSAGSIDDWIDPPTAEFEVIAYSAADAANWAIEQADNRPETEVSAWGPKGARVRRFISWESAIGGQLLAPRVPETLPLF